MENGHEINFDNFEIIDKANFKEMLNTWKPSLIKINFYTKNFVKRIKLRKQRPRKPKKKTKFK